MERSVRSNSPTFREAAFYVLLWRRRGISLGLFDDYWRDVHGPVCARLPGQQRYSQFHLDRADGLWPEIDGVDTDCPEEDRFDGIAELTFATEQDRTTWFEAASILMDDEHNLFRKAIGYNTSLGNSRTYVDRIDGWALNGSPGLSRLHVMIQKADGVEPSAFQEHLAERFCPAVAASDRVLQLRLHLFDKVDGSRPDAAGVVHHEVPEKQYQAALEIAFATSLEMEECFISSAWTRAVEGLPRAVKGMRAFLERSAYTFVDGGRMTVAGQRSSTVAELIEQIGAVNQLRSDVVTLMVTGRLAGRAQEGAR